MSKVKAVDTEIPQSANAITRGILDLLNLIGALAWRNNTGALRPQRRDGSYGFVQFGYRGSGDVLGVLPDGKFISIEVKAGRDRIRESQEWFIEEVNRRDGIAFVAHSLEDVEQALRHRGYIK